MTFVIEESNKNMAGLRRRVLEAGAHPAEL